MSKLENIREGQTYKPAGKLRPERTTYEVIF